ncbi:MAG: gamma carbonic anhydrase family protein [Mariprofundaceae bacterium]|nr:gamma carbonic anhydrase family protein [Mariprofundaceae bacterium]
MISAYQHWLPQVDDSAWLAPSSDVIGRVSIGKDSNIWYQTVLRGDVDEIYIGERSNIQDHCTLHNSAGKPCVIGDDVTVGHRVILHGCNIQNLCLVGMGSIVMDDAVLEEGCLLAAGSLVPERKILKGGFLYAGSPAKERRPLTEKEQAFLQHSAQHYVELARSHRR